MPMGFSAESVLRGDGDQVAEAGFEGLAGFGIGGHVPDADLDDAFLVAATLVIADGLGGREPAGPRHDPGGLLLAGAEPRFASELYTCA